ncbi:Dihydroorotate dehydrogenase (NAD(+)), electron transfer subunit [hydrothermal vent metagenome]|uniref:Dihydroorotate dehydrogenase (NAD(+)), electron transfer subunit n=1 Tax=hydrothermal vent metagenome TaxID=652676 RepID=A0A3B0ZRA0_9ZZZZ
MNANSKPHRHRGTVFVEEAEVLEHQGFDGKQFIMKLQAPRTAKDALPGSFVHLRCSEQRPMRRPLSIMRTDKQKGWIEILYRVFGEGTELLSQNPVGSHINLMGPIGKPFVLNPERPRPLLLGGGVGIPPMVFIADETRKLKGIYNPMIFMGSETPFPFKTRPSQIMVPGLPDDTIAAMPLMEDWGIPSRLASQQDFPGVYQGYITDLARAWLNTLDNAQRNEVELFACGPHPMLEAVAKVAQEFDLPCQVSLEEFMACAIGGCAGCVVKVHNDDGTTAMKRVCVDGPVFPAEAIFPKAS